MTKLINMTKMTKLNRDFYSRDTLTVAKELLGKVLVHDTGEMILKGKIVETEAYLGLSDKAAHSYGGKRTKRLETMYGPPGTAYVYMIWGMYCCLNLVTVKEGIPEAVLIRGIEPVENMDQMILNRFHKKAEELTKNQMKNITNGPGKLALAMNIDRRFDKEDLCGEKICLETGQEEMFHMVETKRIGIDYAEEAAHYPYRFYIEGNPYV